jgi:hypothetical protein
MLEAQPVMRSILPRIVVLACLASSSGCGGLGWYRAAGHIPGIAPTDYAFYNFLGYSSQIFQFTPDQVESSTVVALGDLGFTSCEPATHDLDGTTTLNAKTPDGRPTKITIAARGNNTEMKVAIGPHHIGDEELSRDLFRRVALNFGTAIRAFTPIDPTLPKRINPTRRVPAHDLEHEPPDTLKGEGLRPNQNRDQAQSDAQNNGILNGDGSNFDYEGLIPGYVPGRGSINPNMPLLPFPYIGPSSPAFEPQSPGFEP